MKKAKYTSEGVIFFFRITPLWQSTIEFRKNEKKNCKTHFSNDKQTQRKVKRKWKQTIESKENKVTWERRRVQTDGGDEDGNNDEDDCDDDDDEVVLVGWLWRKRKKAKTCKGVWKWNKYKQIEAHSRQLNLRKVKWSGGGDKGSLHRRTLQGVALDSTVWQLYFRNTRDFGQIINGYQSVLHMYRNLHL